MRLTPIFDTNVIGDIQREMISPSDWRFLLRHRPGRGWPLSTITALELLVGLHDIQPDSFPEAEEANRSGLQTFERAHSDRAQVSAVLRGSERAASIPPCTTFCGQTESVYGYLKTCQIIVRDFRKPYPKAAWDWTRPSLATWLLVQRRSG